MWQIESSIEVFHYLLSAMREKITLHRRTLYTLLVSTILAVALVVNFVNQVGAKESSLTDAYDDLKTFTDVLTLVDKNYVQEVELKQLVEGAVKGMLQNLDPHSSFMNSEAYKELQVETKGEFGGLGIEITVKDNLLTVVSPIEDSPAARAGLMSGDKIIKIGDRFTKDLTLVDAVKMMRGPKGSPVTISVHREGAQDLITVTIIRDVIHVQSVRYRMLDDGFGYVRLAQFQEGSAEEFQQGLTELAKLSKDKMVHGLVLDMRNNPGGLLTQAIKVSDLFLDEGLIVYTDGRLESQKQKYYAHNDKDEPSYPIVVLVNGGSASASEIVAGALQDSKRALIVGTQSFGKGSVQTILPMDGGAALRLTTALYYTRNGRSIQAEGIKPDVTVEARRFPKDTEEVLEEDDETLRGPTKERDLPGAFKNPLNKGKDDTVKAPTPAESKSSTDAAAKKQRAKNGGTEEDKIPIGSRKAMEVDITKLLRDDPQLDEALRLLKTWHIFQRKPTVAQSEKNATPGDA